MDNKFAVVLVIFVALVGFFMYDPKPAVSSTLTSCVSVVVTSTMSLTTSVTSCTTFSTRCVSTSYVSVGG